LQELKKVANNYKLTDIREIPDEWDIKKLEELSDLNAGGTPSRFVNSYWDNGTIPWLSSGEVKNNVIYSSNEKITEVGLSESAAKLFPKGTVLIAITGQGLTRGRTALLGIESTTNQSVVGIVCNKSIMNNMFLWYYLQSQYWKLRSISQGSNQAGLNLALLNSYMILVPPLLEQQKIASILSKVDELIQKTDQIIEQTQRLKKGLMHRLLTKGIGHTKFKKTILGTIPEQWNCKSLREISLKISDRDHFTPKYVNEGVIMVSPVNFKNDEDIDFESCKRISYDAHQLNRRKTDIRIGDIILHRIGAGLGRVRRVTKGMPDFSILHSLAMIRANEHIVSSGYLKWAFRAPHILSQISNGIQSMGVPDLGLNKISELTFPVPDLSEQNKIFLILENLQNQIRLVSVCNTKLNLLKRGLMQKLLTGKLRVKI